MRPIFLATKRSRMWCYLKTSIGHSMGGTLAIDFALVHPERVSSIVVVGSGPGRIEMPQGALDEIISTFEAAQTKSAEAGIEKWINNSMVTVSSKDPLLREFLLKRSAEN